MKWFVSNWGALLPSWMLSVKRDDVGRRTWVEWFPRSKVCVSIGYKLGERIDRIYMQAFGARKLISR